MSLAISILLSTIILSITALFIATKDRWNWKKMVLRCIVGILGLAILVGSGLYFYVYRDSTEYIDIESIRPKAQEDFKSISLGTTKVDVRFFNGNPSEEEQEDNIWIYNDSRTIISFDGNKVSRVLYFCYDSSSYDSNSLQGTRCNDSYHDVVNKFGNPSFISFSKDDLTRVLSYKKYKVFFWLVQNRVHAFGVYSSAYGEAIRLQDEASIEEQPKK